MPPKKKSMTPTKRKTKRPTTKTKRNAPKKTKRTTTKKARRSTTKTTTTKSAEQDVKKLKKTIKKLTSEKRVKLQCREDLRTQIVKPILDSLGMTYKQKHYLPTLNRMVKVVVCRKALPEITAQLGVEFKDYDWAADPKKYLQNKTFIQKLNQIWSQSGTTYLQYLKGDYDFVQRLASLAQQ